MTLCDQPCLEIFPCFTHLNKWSFYVFNIRLNLSLKIEVFKLMVGCGAYWSYQKTNKPDDFIVGN